MALTSCVCFKKKIVEQDFIEEYPEKFSLKASNSDLHHLVKGLKRSERQRDQNEVINSIQKTDLDDDDKNNHKIFIQRL